MAETPISPAVEPLELSRPIAVEGLEKPKTVRIEADANERVALARRFGLDGLEAFTGEVTVTPKRAGRDVHINGHFRAEVRQTCGVTLVPLETVVEGTVLVDYSLDIKDEFSEMEEEGEGNLAGPEPLPAGGVLDLGELLAEALGLEIEPFPRAPGAAFEGPGAGMGGEDAADGTAERPNPFAILKKLTKSGDFGPEKDG